MKENVSAQNTQELFDKMYQIYSLMGEVDSLAMGVQDEIQEFNTLEFQKAFCNFESELKHFYIMQITMELDEKILRHLIDT